MDITAYERAVTVAAMDETGYPAVVHRRLTDQIDKLRPKVEAESTQAHRIWIWWAQLATGLVLGGKKPITKAAVLEKGADAYRELVYLEACAAEFVAANLERYLAVHKGYKNLLRATRAYLADKLTGYRAAIP